MKVTVNKANKDVEYPCLMIGPSGEIILFTGEGIGMNIADNIHLGHYSEAWVMDLFKPFNGSVTLENNS